MALFAAALAVLTSAPYLAGMLLSFPGTRFDHILNFQADFHSYLAFLRQARDGAWLFRNPYTPEPHTAALFNLEWLVFGKLARLLGGSLEAALHVERIGSIFLLAFGLYRLCSMLSPSRWMRRFCLAWLMLGGGFGWVQHIPALGRRVPPFASYDLFAGVHPFHWMLIAPHFLIAQALAVWTVVRLLEQRFAAAAGLLAVTGAVRPFDMLQVSAAIGLYGLLRRSPRALAVAAAPLPLWLYYLWLFRAHPVFRWWSIQNVFPPPRPTALVLSLGISAVLFLYARGGLPALRRPDGQPAPRVLLICSALAGLALLYSFPLLSFSLQILTTVAIPVALVGLSRLREGRGALVLLLVHALTSVVLWRRTMLEVEHGLHRTDRDLIAAYEWLGRNSPARALVLASEADSNRIPRYADNTLFWGYLSTVDRPSKKRLVERFFDPAAAEAERSAFLSRQGIRYVFVRADDPPLRAPLEPVFRNRAAVIYRVLP